MTDRAEAAPGSRRKSLIGHAVAAVVAWLPLLLSKPGQLAADTRPYLYLDPGGFISRSRNLWDPFIHLGTVTHQNMGIVVPMGTWFWSADRLGLPDWVAQRIWVGAILFAAAAGVLHLGRTLAWPFVAAAVAAPCFALSPYLLQYVTTTSVLLLPFAGLPWLISFAIRAVHQGGWRDPAAFAVVVFLVGSVNATSFLLAGLGPLLWVLWALFTGDVPRRAVLVATARMGVLAAVVSIWWVVALLVQAQHGLPVLTYTETINDVATTSSAPEVLRGLGYWVFYGRDALDPNVGAAVAYTQNPVLLVLSYLLPGLGLLAAFTVRFRHRGYFVGLVGVGVLVAVGAHSISDPSPLASLFRDAAGSTAGLALRSSTRAAPLATLGLAACLGHGVAAIRRPARRTASAWAVGALALAVLPALLTGGLVDPSRSFPEELPQAWQYAGAWLEDQPGDGGVLEIPGAQFAYYRWGYTFEPVTAGLTDRAFLAREQLPYGSPPSADLVSALDRRLQEGLGDTRALPIIARMLGVQWIVVRNDLAFERYRSPRPRDLAGLLDPLPPGLTVGAEFGPTDENRPDARLPLLDEKALALPDDIIDPAPVRILEVSDPGSHLRLVDGGVVVIEGDGEGLVDAAAVGLVDGSGTVLYGATVLDDPDLLDRVAAGAGTEAPAIPLIVTDTNRKRVRRWRSVRWNTGYTERADEVTAARGDAGLAVFEGAAREHQTTVDQVGGTVDASGYGSPYTLDPDTRPALAVDGDPSTAWSVGPFADPIGQTVTLRGETAQDPASVTLLQRQAGSDQWITEVELTVGDGPPQRVALDDRSRTAPGQPIPLKSSGPSDQLQVRITLTSTPPGVAPTAAGPVGFAEIGFGDLRVVEWVVLPSAAVDSEIEGPVTYLMTRLRSDPAEPVRSDEERTMRRRFRVGPARTFELRGEVRLSAHASGPLIDALTRSPGGPVVTASSSLPGALRRRPSAALDGDETTRWEPAFRDLEGAWLQASQDAPIDLDRLELAVVSDGRHSVPTRIRVEVDGSSQEVDLPPIADGGPAGSTTAVSVPLTPVSGRVVRVTVTAARPVVTTDYYTRADIALPVGIAELGLPGVAASPVLGTLDTGCRDDLITLDGQAIAVRVRGAVEDAVDRSPLMLSACGPLELAPGDHELETADGAVTGLDLDRLVLAPPGSPTPGGTPRATIDLDGGPALSHDGDLPPGAGGWLSLTQSHEDGWQAEVDGTSLGAPVLVNGASNGWFVEPDDTARTVSVRWTPQRLIDWAMLLSGAAVVLCALVLIASRRRGFVPAAPASLPRLDAPIALVVNRDRWAWLALAGAAVVGALALHPAAAPLTAAAMAIALWDRRGRRLVVGTGLAAWVLAVVWIVGSQVVRPRRPDFEWVAGSLWPHRLTLLAVLLLLVTATADRLRRRPDGVRPSEPRAAAEPEPSSAATTPHALRFLAGCAAGGLLALVLYGWLLTVGQVHNLDSWQRVGDFYDNQAKAWLDGHWDLPPETLGIERFEARGKAYMYQGPWPALLRLPVFAVTERFEGRLTQASMLAAMAVAIAGAAWLQWRIRQVLRRSAPVSHLEGLVAGGLTFAVTGGSALLFTASRAWVYHEAIVWGVAWSLVALAAIVGVATRPSRRDLLVAASATTLALCSRSSVGLGPVGALALLAAGNAIIWIRARLGTGSRAGQVLRRLGWVAGAADQRGRRPIFGPALAATLPVAVYAATNWIKFRTLFSIPFEKQGFTIVDPGRQEMLAQNGGSLFGLKFLPTTVIQYLRPDAARLTDVFPFVDFADPIAPIGGARFDLIDRATSIPVAMPALLLLALVGVLVLTFRGWGAAFPAASSLRSPVLGALGGALTILPFAYIANRYLADVVPFMAIAGFIGGHALLSRHGDRPLGRRGAAVLLLVAGLVAVSLWVNLSASLIYQRLYSPNVKDDVIADFVDQRYDVSQGLGLDPTIPLIEVDQLPPTAPRGTLAVVGDCDALYLSDDMEVNAVKITPWNAVERTEAAGRWLRRVTFPTQPPGTRQPLWSSTSAEGDQRLYAEWTGGPGVVFVWEEPRQLLRSPIRYIPPDQEWTMDLVVDRNVRMVYLWLDGKLMLETYDWSTTPPEQTALGRNVTSDTTLADEFTGLLEPLPERVGVCSELRSEARSAR